MRQCDFAGQQRVIVGNVGRLINGTMLQLNTQAGPELFNIKLIPTDAQLFADCFCLTRGKLFFAHNIKLIGNCFLPRRSFIDVTRVSERASIPHEKVFLSILH